MSNEKVLIVDDDESVRWVLKKSLEKDGMETALAKNAAEALERIGEGDIAVALMDIRMPGMSGFEALEQIQTGGSAVSVIIMTAQATMQNAIEAMRRGAFDYITKPFDLDEVNILVRKAIDVRRLSLEVNVLRAEVREKYEGGLVGNTSAMQEIYKTIGRVAESDATVLIHGESGTGKELVARAIHYHSKRAGRPFVAVNSAAIPSELLESELFGHEKGSFTGAVARKIGKFEAAAGGTLFLDEIGDMTLPLQGKLLRVLQEREFERVGGTEAIKTEVRVIAATHRNLEKYVREKRFREDLFYRLNVIQINIPPLRKRKDDIPPLADFFMQKHQTAPGKARVLTPETLKVLRAYDWPGNVRELENAIQRAITLSPGDKIFPDALPPQIFKPGHGVGLSFENFLEEKLADLVDRMGGLETGDIHSLVIQRVEKPLITLVLKKTEGNQVRAANLLGINRNTLRKKIKELGIKGPFGAAEDEGSEEEE
ncbi:MAG: two-component system response regulator [Nitrospirae bacterium GWD2_57_9]|nr:MAG: two-component system response regulator [Nitrospirae bacterium GWD2_57_9]